MKVLQTLMIDLVALLGFAGLLTVLLIFLTSSLEDTRRWAETQYIFFSWLISFFHLSLWRCIRFSPQPFSIQFCILHPLDHLLCMPFESSLLPHTKYVSCFSLYRLLPSYVSSLVWVALTSFVLVTSPSLSTSRKSADTIALLLVSALPEFAFILFTCSFLFHRVNLAHLDFLCLWFIVFSSSFVYHPFLSGIHCLYSLFSWHQCTMHMMLLWSHPLLFWASTFSVPLWPPSHPTCAIIAVLYYSFSPWVFSPLGRSNGCWETATI